MMLWCYAKHDVQIVMYASCRVVYALLSPYNIAGGGIATSRFVFVGSSLSARDWI